MIAVEGFETPRMRAEPIGARHRDGLIALLGDPRVGATLGGVAGPAAVDAQIAGMTAHWEREGFGWYAFLDRETGALVARGGPHRCHVAGNDETEIGWAVVPERWNEGLATELGAASLDLAFGPLGLARRRLVHAPRQPRLTARDGEARLRVRARHRVQGLGRTCSTGCSASSARSTSRSVV